MFDMPGHYNNGFENTFHTGPALSDADRRDVFRIRHEVYCEDLGWEPIQADGMEVDEYDRNAVHGLMRIGGNRGHNVACFRLVLPCPENLQSPLPVEAACAHTLDRTCFDPMGVNRRSIAEVSRLAVRAGYRQGGSLACQKGAVAHLPWIPIGLYLCALAIAEVNHVEHLLLLTEPRLAKHLRRIGFVIEQIGGPIQHRGTRIPSVIHTSATIGGFRPRLQTMWHVVRQSVSDEFLQLEQVAHPR
ncbi:PEP-CTERM/exosortase system-associated acyltransferase [Cupriavidus necator]